MVLEFDEDLTMEDRYRQVRARRTFVMTDLFSFVFCYENPLSCNVGADIAATVQYVNGRINISCDRVVVQIRLSSLDSSNGPAGTSFGSDHHRHICDHIYLPLSAPPSVYAKDMLQMVTRSLRKLAG